MELFFPAMLLIIGGRYLTFASLYGMKIYWALGATLAIAVVPLLLFKAPVAAGALAGALIEFAFALLILSQLKRQAT
jgi:hypothetical protein